MSGESTKGMTIEQRAEFIADGPRPGLDRSGQRWQIIYRRAILAMRDTELEARGKSHLTIVK